jgi:iron-sulfur cluster repair protein YtfE (RIC family)
MVPLLEELKAEHERISSHLRTVYNLGPSSPQARKELRAVRTLLLTHLHRENELLFPLVRKAYERDAAAKALLDTFVEEEDALADLLLQFFSKYDSAEVSSIQFARDFGSLWATISARMRREENRVFPMFAKLVVAK